jgi:hypothetical protein
MNFQGETSTCKAFSWQVWGTSQEFSHLSKNNRPERNGLSACREEFLEKNDKSLRLDRLKRFSDIQNCLWGNLNAHKLLKEMEFNKGAAAVAAQFST